MARTPGAAGGGPLNLTWRCGNVKAKIFRAGMAVAMLAAVLQAFGAYIKW